MDPGHVAFAEVDFEPPDQWSKLLLLVGGQLVQLILASLELFRIVDKVPNHELVFSRLVLELVHDLEKELREKNLPFFSKL